LNQRQSKESVDDDAEMNRKEVLKKLASGKIKLDRSDERHSFKRSKVVRKVRPLSFFKNSSRFFRNRIPATLREQVSILVEWSRIL
jgi:hypothetical protein